MDREFSVGIRDHSRIFALHEKMLVYECHVSRSTQSLIYSVKDMFRFLSPATTPLTRSFLLASAVGLSSFSQLVAQSTESSVSYDVRALTNDKIKTLTGNARQGSFGSPAINDKGNVAYACVISGGNIGALTSYAVLYRAKGKKKKSVLAIQSGTQKGFNSPTGLEQDPSYQPTLYINDPRTLNDNFLVYGGDSGTLPVPWTGHMNRISKEVAINNKNYIAFAGEFIQTLETVTRDDTGMITKWVYRSQNYSAIGAALPFGKLFTNSCITTYLNFFDEILTRKTSINTAGSVPFNGSFQITTGDFVPGFAYNNPAQAFAVVATVQSNVIGLPYFTTFTAFSDAVIAAKNVCFIVANISETGAQFDGIWQGSNPNLQPVVTISSTAPTGGTYTAFDPTVGPSPNAKYVAFLANVTGGRATRGVFRANKNGEDAVNIATVGGDATGNKAFADFTLAASNNKGQVAFVATVNGAGGNVLDGIWLSDGEDLTQVVVQGQEIQVGKTLKKVSNVAFSPIAGLNSKGQVAFTASFTDRTSAVIVATP
jgi:hypothetical protein